MADASNSLNIGKSKFANVFQDKKKKNRFLIGFYLLRIQFRFEVDTKMEIFSLISKKKIVNQNYSSLSNVYKHCVKNQPNESHDSINDPKSDKLERVLELNPK